MDGDLTGTQNLVLLGRLLGASRSEAARRDLASSLVGRPDVVFLDEPTTGLNPESRLGMWEIVRTLVQGGTTVLLTTSTWRRPTGWPTPSRCCRTAGSSRPAPQPN